MQHFMTMDQVKKGNAKIEHCHTDNVTSDHMTEPVQGIKCNKFRNKIVGHSDDQETTREQTF